MVFAVTVRRIAEVLLHPNADRLEIVRLEDYDYDSIVQKGMYAVGDRVVYFPVDSQIPLDFVQAMGLEGKLSHGMPDEAGGRLQNRVKTAKLRGIVSQGIVAKPQDLPVPPDVRANLDAAAWGADVAGLLGVLKYEPPVVPTKEGRLVGLPSRVNKYDLENAQSHASVVAHLLESRLPVLITEKIEGSHWFVTRTRDGEWGIGQRNYRIEPVAGYEHDWHRVAREGDFSAHTQAILDQQPQVQRVTIRGELIGPGVQGNYYNLPKHRILVFEIEFDGRPVDARLFLQLVETLALPAVPILSAGVALADVLAAAGQESLKAYSNGPSQLAPQRLREGVVIRPMTEQSSEALSGRLILKQRSPDYLAKTEN